MAKMGKYGAVLKIGVISTLYVLLLLGTDACSPASQTSGGEPGSRFSKIYDKSDKNASYTAVDMVQTGTGYLILGMDRGALYLLKIKENGDFSKDALLDNYVAPNRNLLQIGQEYYIFCNEKSAENPKPIMLRITLSHLDIQPFTIAFDFYYDGIGPIEPVHAVKIHDNGFLLLTKDGSWGDIYLFKLDKYGENIGAGRCFWPSSHCRSGYSHTDNRFHFTGDADNPDVFYFQSYSGYYYPTSTVFDCETDELTDTTDDESGECFRIEVGDPESNNTIDKFLVERPFTAMHWHVYDINGINFSGAAVSENDIVMLYVNSSMEPTMDAVYTQPELHAEKPVFIKTAKVKGEDIVFFAATTNAGNIVLYAYGLLDRNILGKTYFGGTRFYEAADLIGTNDGGLAILGTTNVLDRIKRICLFKLSSADLEEMVRDGQ